MDRATIAKLITLIDSYYEQRSNDADEWMEIGELVQLSGLSAPTIKRWCETGQMPAPVVSGGRGVRRRWRRADIIKWLRQRDGF